MLAGFHAVPDYAAWAMLRVKARDMVLAVPTIVAGAPLSYRSDITSSMFTSVTRLDRALWAHVSWFALACIRPVLACPSNGAAVKAQSSIHCTVFSVPVCLTFAYVRFVATPTVCARYAAFTDELAVNT